MARLLRSGTALALLLVAAVPLPGAGAGAPTGDDLQACGPQVTIGRDGWARIAAPEYAGGQGLPGITASAAPAGLRKRVYVTNGTVVKMSDSAGCRWDHVFPRQNNVAPPDVAEPVITHVVAPTDKSLWLASYDSGGGLPRPHVAMTPDASYTGSHETKEPIGYVDEGLPALGKPVALLVPQYPQRAYLLLEEPIDPGSPTVGEVTRRLYRLTVDDQLEDVTGRKRFLWENVPLPAALAGVRGLAMSRRQTDTVWAWSGRTYGWSDDAGTTWRTRKAPGTVTAIDVDDSAKAAVFSKAGDGGLMQRLDVRRAVRETRGTPVAVDAVAHGYQSGTYAITGRRRTYGYEPVRRRWIDITPADRPAFASLHLGSTANGRILLGQTAGRLYRFDLYRGESFVPRPPEPLVGTPPRPGPGGVLGFTPEHQVVTVAPGQEKDAPVELDLPASADRIDVFFLIDTTSSMTAAIKGLREGVRAIADEVTEQTRGPACFGVGEVKDFSVADNPWYGAAAVTPYKLQKKITCDLDVLSEGLAALSEGGGDKYPEEAQTIGLTQAVRGDGQLSPPVAPGQDAGFVAKTRVIVLITDAGFKMAPQFEGFPAMDDTVRTLRSFDNKTNVVGVLLQTRNDLGPAFADMTEVARRTDTFAPAGGADCDGDGRRDLAPGEPLVCKAENYAPSIAPAIVALLLGVKQNVGTAIRAHDPHHVVVGTRTGPDEVAPGTSVHSVVNDRVPNRLPFRPVVTCSWAQDGQDLPVRVVASKGGSPVAYADIVVRCRGDKSVPPPRRPQRLPDPPDLVDVVRRPVLAPVLLPPFQVPPVNNPPPNLNPNAGFSQQEEEQFQLAAVTQDESAEDEADEVELAMSGVRPEDAAARLLFGCAALTSLAGGVVLSRRRRVQRSLRAAYVLRR
jgi:hypothetical protein